MFPEFLCKQNSKSLEDITLQRYVHFGYYYFLINCVPSNLVFSLHFADFIYLPDESIVHLICLG